ncbi:MAG: hypothetical protein ACLU99_01425 [Alphaproteobacteria bacterium]
MKNEKQIASVPTVWYNAQDLKSSNEAGYYMLKDNRRSRDSVYDYEKGIVINDDIYLTLNYPKHELTKSEAQAFAELKAGASPTALSCGRFKWPGMKSNAALLVLRIRSENFLLIL